jgi:catechol 2,3-dioxygenase-like lactoylglutathione lyase family enzyme
MRIERLDHLVLTVADVERAVAFYTDVLGMRVEVFDAGRTALHFGTTKINLHQVGKEFDPKAQRPTPGSADLCLIAADAIHDICDQLAARGVPVEEGPVDRTGATSPLRSVYLRDPDGNLIEISNPIDRHAESVWPGQG